LASRTYASGTSTDFQKVVEDANETRGSLASNRKSLHVFCRMRNPLCRRGCQFLRLGVAIWVYGNRQHSLCFLDVVGKYARGLILVSEKTKVIVAV
jgi:hypothetical protein